MRAKDGGQAPVCQPVSARGQSRRRIGTAKPWHTGMLQSLLGNSHCRRSLLLLPHCRVPFILADSVAEVSLGLKLWGVHLPPLEPTSGFHVEFIVVHSGGEHWGIGEPCCAVALHG